MGDVFISYVEEDGEIIRQLATGVEQAGFSTWYYQRDSVPGLRHFDQTRKVIKDCQTVLLVISSNTLRSSWVDREVEWAVDSGKPIIPVLLEISYDEFKEQQTSWSYLISPGTVAVYLTKDNLDQVIPRMIAGFHGLGVTPQRTGLIAKIADDYPYPLANAYAGKLAHVSGPEQAYQHHQGLGNLAATFIKYLATITIVWYRQISQQIGGEVVEVENRLADLHNPNLENWMGLLYACLNLPAVASDELIQAIYEYLYDRRHRKDEISELVTQIYNWLQIPTKTRPSVTYEDFFDALVVYHNHPQGWGSQGAMLSAEIYQERAKLLRAGLEAALLEAEFLSEYPLLFIQSEDNATAGTGAHNIYLASGRNLVVKDEKISPNRIIEAGHITLCDRTASGLQGRLDLHPLLNCQICKRCNQLSMFFLASNKNREPEWISHTCGHTQALTPVQTTELSKLISLEKWRLQYPPAALRPVVNTLRQIYADGIVTPEERKNLEFLVEAMGIQPEQADQLESLIVDEMKVEIAEPEVEEPPEPSQSPPQPIEIPLDEGKPGAPKTEVHQEQISSKEPDAAPAGKSTAKYILNWQESLPASSVQIAIFGNPPQVFAATESGEVHIFSIEGQPIYQDRFPAQIFRLVGSHQDLFAGNWDGHVYRFNSKGLVWQLDLHSPVSALAFQSQSGLVVAGTWAGEVVGIDMSAGMIRWQTKLQDGISTLEIQPENSKIACGTYGGHVAILDTHGEKIWLRDLYAGISQIRFLGRNDEILVASLDANLTSLNIDNQQVIWEQALAGVPRQVELSASRRRLFIVSAEKGLHLYNLDGKPSLWKKYAQAGLEKLLMLPYSPEGNTLLAFSSQAGIFAIDNLTNTMNLEIDMAAICAGLSPTGRYLVIGEQENISLYRIAQPILKIKLTCQEELRLGRFTRLGIQIENNGEIDATDISLSLEGAFDCQGIKIPSHLPAGQVATSTNQSLRPEAEGALPIKIHVKYSDSLGFQHEVEDIQVLDVSSIE